MSSANHALKRELKLADLVLLQVILIVGLNFIGYAAKQGPTHVVLWLLAMVLFYVPLAVAVMNLSRALPLEGGVYQWVKVGISPFAGYMAGWFLTIYIICYSASYGSQLAEAFAFVGGRKYGWLGTTQWFPLLFMILFCGLAFVLNVRGLHAAKRLSSAGSLLVIALVLVLLYLLLKSPGTLKPSAGVTLSHARPGFSMFTLNVFTKMALFALSGFEQCAVFTEECRKPKNDVARSVLIAAPLIALIYIISTYALLAYIAPSKVDVAAPLSQALQAGFGYTWMGRALTALAVGAYAVVQVATLVVVVGMVARLPMVAGWDGLLPIWWSELDPQSRVPTKAIGAVAVTLMVMSALSLLGAHNQEAVQVLSAVGFGGYCLMYLLMFGAILFGFRSTAWRPGIAIRMAALAALSVVLVSLGFELIPVGEVANPLLFAIKVTGGISAVSGAGAYLYRRGILRRSATAPGAELV